MPADYLRWALIFSIKYIINLWEIEINYKYIRANADNSNVREITMYRFEHCCEVPI